MDDDEPVEWTLPSTATKDHEVETSAVDTFWRNSKITCVRTLALTYDDNIIHRSLVYIGLYNVDIVACYSVGVRVCMCVDVK